MLAKEWFGLHDHSWTVAQVKSSIQDVVDALQKMRSVRITGEQTSAHVYEVTSEAFSIFVVYSIPDSDFTFLESVVGFLDIKTLAKISKQLKTDVLSCGFEDNSGTSGYECFRNGTIIESCETGDADFFDPQSDCYEGRASDGKEKAWTMNSKMTLRYFSKLPSNLDIESASFIEYWEEISEKLALVVPHLKWSLTGVSPLKFEPNSKPQSIAESFLFELT